MLTPKHYRGKAPTAAAETCRAATAEDIGREEDILDTMTDHQFDRIEELTRADERSKLQAEIDRLTEEAESLRRQLEELTAKQNGAPSSTQ